MKDLFTSESVTEGHPDKMADQISDAILDAIYAQDPQGRVAAETLVATGMVLVAGQITTSAYVDFPKVIRQTVRDIGYTRARYGMDAESCAILTSIDEQSPDIAMGVDRALEVREGAESFDLGAGDQGMVFGFACDETPELMPLPISLAQGLARRLSEVRKSGLVPYLWPDGKSQVTVEYEDGRPVRLGTVVISTQHAPTAELGTIREAVIEEVIRPVVPAGLMDGETRILVNPTGRFVVGGPQGDTGLTGRKIIVDTYGGYARHGGGAFSGKDPTKVDRSGAYAARWVAKNIVAAGLARKVEVQIAYAIGVAHPVSVRVESFGTGRLSDDRLSALAQEVFDLRPAAIIETLHLRRPIYRQTAAYGHFGRLDLNLPWEQVSQAVALQERSGLRDLSSSIG